jgi:hypothetical protein
MKRIDKILEAIDTGLQSSNEVQYYGDTYDYCWRCTKVLTENGGACEKCIAWMSCESDEDPVEIQFTYSFIEDEPLEPIESLSQLINPDSRFVEHYGRMSENNPREQRVPRTFWEVYSEQNIPSSADTLSPFQRAVREERRRITEQLLRDTYIQLYSSYPREEISFTDITTT